MIRRKSKLIHGFGINDADYEVYTVVDGLRKRCPYYTRWTNMIGRVYGKVQLKSDPTYQVCSICDEWKSFMSFRSWMIEQDWEGNHLDKDLLVEGNKVYGPENCLFIPRVVNIFMTDSLKARGEWPIGVRYRNDVEKFSAQCGGLEKGKHIHLGLFFDANSAHQAYVKKKKELAIHLASFQTDKVIGDALIKRYSGENNVNSATSD